MPDDAGMRSRPLVRHRRRPAPPAELAELDDAGLVVTLARGDEAALAELYRRYAPAVYGLAVRVLGDADAAQEILQEVVVSVWERPERFDPTRGALRPYLLRVTHGRCVDRIRSESRRLRREDADVRGDRHRDADLEREVWELVRAETVRDALGSLAEGEREAIELAYFGGHTYREVAVLLGLPEGTVKSRIRTGLAKLADRLEAAGLGPGTVEEDRR